MRIKKSLLWGILIVVVLVVGGAFLLKGGISGNVVSVNGGSVQVVKMHVEGGNYVFEPASVKVGEKVRIEADMSRMPGCSRSFVMGEFGIRKTFSNNDNSIEFTPTKAGTFYVACSMNMYKGSFVVLEANGTKSNYLQPQSANVQTSGGSCGASGGGCGCGGGA